MKKPWIYYFALLSLSLQAKGLSLQEAQDLILRRNPTMKSADQLYEAVEKEKQATRAARLPTIKLEYEKGRNQSADQPSAVQNSMIEVRAELKNPFSHTTIQAAWELEQQDIRLSQTAQKHTLLHSVRLAYFKACQLEHQLASAQKILHTRREEQDLLLKKTQQVLIPILDQERIKQAFRKQQQVVDSLTARQETYDSAVQKVLQLPTSTFSFDTPFPENFALPTLGSKPKTPPIVAQKAAVARDKNQNLLQQERMKWTPDFFVSYQDGRREGELDTRAFLLGFTWTLSAEPYYKQKALELRMESGTLLYEQELQTQQARITQSLNQLKETLTTLQSQGDIIRSSQKIAMESRRQYQHGGIPIQMYHEDVRSWTQEVDRALELRYQAVEQLADLSLATEEEDLFYQGIQLK